MIWTTLSVCKCSSADAAGFIINNYQAVSSNSSSHYKYNIHLHHMVPRISAVNAIKYIFFYHIDLQVVKMRYRLNSETIELHIWEPLLGAVPDKITYMENMVLLRTIQNTFACAGILQEGDETEGIYCRASYIIFIFLRFNSLFTNQKMKMSSTDCPSVDKLLPSSFCSVQNLEPLK